MPKAQCHCYLARETHSSSSLLHGAWCQPQCHTVMMLNITNYRSISDETHNDIDSLWCSL